IRHDDVEVVSTGTGDAALKLLAEREFDCIVLDLGLPDVNGLELLERIEREQPAPGTPIVVFTGRDLSEEDDARLRKVAKSVIIKGVQSPERLFDETALFLHRVIADLPQEKRQLLDNLHSSNEALHGRKVLIVDDDIRNIFA